MVSVNNQSIRFCKEIAEINGWEKEPRRNVLNIDGERWSFSVSSESSLQRLECRQTYEDTVGVLSYSTHSNKLYAHRISSFEGYNVSRIAASGLRAYNVSVYTVDCDAIFFEKPIHDMD